MRVARDSRNRMVGSVASIVSVYLRLGFRGGLGLLDFTFFRPFFRRLARSFGVCNGIGISS